MTNTSNDSGRVSTIHGRPRATEWRFLALCRALAPLQAYDAGRRSVATGADGRGAPPELTATERASDAGDLGLAAGPWRRIARTPWAAQQVLGWIATRAGGNDLASLARRYAEEFAPVALREAANATPDGEREERASAPFAAKVAADAYGNAKRLASAAPTPETLLRAVKAKEAHDNARSREAQAVAALDGWGRDAMEAALEAWERAADRRDEAA